MTTAARATTEIAIAALLRASLTMWRIAGTVEPASGSAIVVRTPTAELHIRRAPAELPFRWIVSDGGRERGSGSVIGLLRHVRQAIDAAYRPARLRIATPPTSS